MNTITLTVDGKELAGVVVQALRAPIPLAADEQDALLEYFRHVYLGYEAKRQPIHKLLDRIERAKREAA